MLPSCFLAPICLKQTTATANLDLLVCLVLHVIVCSSRFAFSLALESQSPLLPSLLSEPMLFSCFCLLDLLMLCGDALNSHVQAAYKDWLLIYAGGTWILFMAGGEHTFCHVNIGGFSIDTHKGKF